MASTLGSLALVRALGPAAMAEIWNPWMGLVPLLLLAFVVWSIVDGDRFLLPLAVLLASFAMHAHLGLLFPAAALSALAVVGGWGPSALRRRWPAGSTRALVGAVVVGVVCWALPIHQQLTGDPGNLTQLARSNGDAGPRGGALAIKATLWRSLGVPPIWAQGEQEPLHFASISFFPIGWAQVVQVVAVLGGLAALFVLAVRRRDRVVALGPRRRRGAGRRDGGHRRHPPARAWPGCRLHVPLVRGRRCTSVWFAAGLGLARLVVLPAWRTRPGAGREPSSGSSDSKAWCARRSPAGRAGPRRRRHADAAVEGPVRLLLRLPARTLGREVVAATEPGGRYLVGRSGRWDLAFSPVIEHELRKAGRHPVAIGTRIDVLGAQYAADGRALRRHRGHPGAG